MIPAISSPETLKRRAVRIKREQGCKHHVALDIAATEFGFQNFKDAVRSLAETDSPRFNAILSQYWYNHQKRQSGMETLSVPLRQPLVHLLKPHHLTEYLNGDRLVGEDGLALPTGGYQNDDAEYAMRRLRREARVLEFIEITGLRPSNARRCYPRGDWDNRPPMADHDHCWFDPATRQYVLTTEPYPGRASAKAAEMEAWSSRHGYDLMQARWGSIYGYGTELWLAAKRGSKLDLAGIVSHLEAMPTAFRHE